MIDFLLFRRMLTPVLLQIFFWISVVMCLITGIANFFNEEGWQNGLLVIFLGPLFARIFCELLILFFTMNETLTDIKHLLSPTLTSRDKELK